jgi:hypothetical protein
MDDFNNNRTPCNSFVPGKWLGVIGSLPEEAGFGLTIRPKI